MAWVPSTPQATKRAMHVGASIADALLCSHTLLVVAVVSGRWVRGYLEPIFSLTFSCIDEFEGFVRMRATQSGLLGVRTVTNGKLNASAQT